MAAVNNQSTAQWAEFYRKCGLHILALKSDGDGKAAREAGWPCASPDHWEKCPTDNIGWLMGDDYVALDFDICGDKQGKTTLAYLTESFPEIAETLTQRSRSGGWHKVFELTAKQRGELRPRANVNIGPAGKLSGLDIRSGRSYIVIEPSVSEGKGYQWEDIDVDPLPLPDGLFDLLVKAGGDAQPSDADYSIEPDKMLREMLPSPLKSWMRAIGLGDTAVTNALRTYEKGTSSNENRLVFIHQMIEAECTDSQILGVMLNPVVGVCATLRAKMSSAGAINELFRARDNYTEYAAKRETASTIRRAKQSSAGRDQKPWATYAEIHAALTKPDVCGATLRFDDFSQRNSIQHEGGEPAPWGRHEVSHMRVRLETFLGKQVKKTDVEDGMRDVAARNVFDSAQDWLAQLPEWDGKARLDATFPTYLGTDNTPYTRAVGRYLWSALVGRILYPGCQADMVPVLVGAQGLRKSTALGALVPADWSKVIDFHDRSDNTLRLMTGTILGVFEELSGLGKRDHQEIKSFITGKQDNRRALYEDQITSYKRRAVFAGSTNEEQFLSDPTGHRRWLPVAVVRPTDEAALRRDCLQLWAEAHTRFSAPDSIDWNDAERLAKNEHDAYTEDDDFLEPLRLWLESAEAFFHKPFSTSDAYDAIQVPIERRDKVKANRIGSCLRRLGYEYKTVRDGKFVRKQWCKKAAESGE